MDIEIRKLTPDLAEAYVHFFDVTPHDVNIDEQKCYCITWRNDSTYEGNDHWYATREERRARALGFVKSGCIQGYFAYLNGEIIGWCNATADCQGGVAYLRSFWPIEEPREGVRIKSIFCFVIAPHLQRQGIATRILERICEDATQEGFDFVEAYTNENHTDLDFRGPLAMYEKCGFYRCAKQDGRIVVRKALQI